MALVFSLCNQQIVVANGQRGNGNIRRLIILSDIARNELKLR